MKATNFPCATVRLPAGCAADVERLRANAARCYRLAKAISDPEVERVLRALAREYEMLAEAMEPKLSPA